MKPGSTADRFVSFVVAAGGVTAIGYGLWQVYPPATWIFCGAIAVIVGTGGLLPAKAVPAQ